MSAPNTNGGALEKAPSSHERLMFGSNVLIGYKVEVQMKSGVVHEGIFHTAHFDAKGMNVVLKFSRVVKDPNAKLDALAEKPKKMQLLDGTEVVQVVARDVRMTPEDLSTTEDFETDANIGRGKGGMFGRDLQKWVPDDGEEAHEFHLEEDSTGWDQFAINKEKFGVETTFNEEFYTTRLDKNNAAITEEEAMRIAREIEHDTSQGFKSGKTVNYHLLEERGQEVDDGGLDEEDKYSSVIRQPAAPGGQPGMPGRSRVMQQAPGGPPAVRAWGGVGAGVAAVAGRHGQPPPPPGPHPGMMMQPPPPPRPAMPAGVANPVDMDPLRRETNKVRSQLVSGALPIKKIGGGQDMRGASPFGTPKSPINSPLVSDGATLMALNIEAVPANKHLFDQDLLKEFANFKNRKNQEKEKEESEKRLQDLKAAAASSKAEKPADGAGVSGSADKPAEGSEPPKKSGLNPFAKAFTLNISAKEFVPSFGKPAAAPTPVPPAPVVLQAPVPVVPIMPVLPVPAVGMPAPAYAAKGPGGMGMAPVAPSTSGYVPGPQGHMPVRAGMPQPGMHVMPGPGHEQPGMHMHVQHMQGGKPGGPGMGMDAQHQHHQAGKMGAGPQQPGGLPSHPPPQQQQAPSEGGAGGPHGMPGHPQGPIPIPMQPIPVGGGAYMQMQGGPYPTMAVAPGGMAMAQVMPGQVMYAAGPGGPMRPGMAPNQGPGGPQPMMMPMMQQPMPHYGYMPAMPGVPPRPYPGGHFGQPGFPGGMMPGQQQMGMPQGPGMDGHHQHPHGGHLGGRGGPGGPKGVGGRGRGGMREGLHHYPGMPQPQMVLQVAHEGSRGPHTGPPPPPPPTAAVDASAPPAAAPAGPPGSGGGAVPAQ